MKLTEIESVLNQKPTITGKSKALYTYDEQHYVAQLIPSLSSFTFERYELVNGTAELRLDFYEMAVKKLNAAGIKTAFVKRLGPITYLTKKCTNPPFEVIVKNYAVGSTLRKYPGLFKEGQKFSRPIVKFDYRIDPEDLPIAADYLREYGENPDELKRIALETNRILCQWLNPRVLIDFCLIFGTDNDGNLCISSEISPDCMRLKSEKGEPLDKDLFRQGKSHSEIIEIWTSLIDSLKQ